MSELNLDIYRRVFDDLPMTDKRSLLRTCKIINAFTSLMPAIELEFQKKLKRENFMTPFNYNRYLIYSALYKYFVELLYDERDVPERYVIGKNELVRCGYIYRTLARHQNLILIQKMLQVCPSNCLDDNLTFIIEGSFEVGNFKILKWLRLQNYLVPHKAIVTCSANVGNIKFVKRMVGHFGMKLNIPYLTPTSKDPVFRKIFSYLIDQKMMRVDAALLSAATTGDLELTKYLLVKYSGYSIGGFNMVIQTAVTDDHFELLKYVSGIIEEPLQCTFRPSSIDVTEWLAGHDMFKRCTIETSEAAKRGNLECLQYMYSKGYDVLTKDVFRSATISGNVELIKWLHDLNCPFNFNSIMNGLCVHPKIKHSLDTKIKILDLFIERGVKLTESTSEIAIFTGDLEFLQYIHKNGGIINENTINTAARCGYLHIIIWCREIGCPWSPMTCQMAAEQSLDILKWLRGVDRDSCLIKSSEKEICPWDASVYEAGVKLNRIDMLVFLQSMNLNPCR